MPIAFQAQSRIHPLEISFCITIPESISQYGFEYDRRNGEADWYVLPSLAEAALLTLDILSQ